MHSIEKTEFSAYFSPESIFVMLKFKLNFLYFYSTFLPPEYNLEAPAPMQAQVSLMKDS